MWEPKPLRKEEVRQMVIAKVSQTIPAIQVSKTG
jgi:hypothetical protein